MPKHTRIVSEQDHVLRTTGPQINAVVRIEINRMLKARIPHLPTDRDVRVPTKIWPGPFFIQFVICRPIGGFAERRIARIRPAGVVRIVCFSYLSILC